MEQLVRVQKLNADGTAQVLHIRQSACSGDCHKCSGCGAQQQAMLVTAENPIHAKPGQYVTIRASSGPVLLAAVVVYLIPLVLFIAGYLCFMQLGATGWLGGLLGFALGIALAAIYDRLVARRRKTVYTITGFAQSPAIPEEGDNDLD